MIDLKKLRCFVAVAEEGHFGRAAIRLGMSQPPLSEHIHRLETHLGTKLLKRDTRNVSLTAEGLALLEHSKKILLDIDGCYAIVNNPSIKTQRRLRIGMLHAHTYTFFPGLLRFYLETRGDHRIELIEYTTKEQVETLLSGLVDFGLVREPIRHSQIKVQTLFSEPYALAAPTSWRLGSRNPICVGNLEGRPMIYYPSHDDRRSTRTLFRDYLQEHGIKISDPIEVKTMHAALALVAAGQGFAPVPKSQTVMRLKGLSYHPFKQTPPQLSVGLAWRKGDLTEEAHEFIKDATTYFEKMT